tara:strand:- start:879 stop:1073 length:195 start_codon:yes stop_codon:yes gene_type:complete
MPYSSQYTLEESTEILKTMDFPLEFLKEGDLVWVPGGKLGTDIGHRFRWDGSKWVSDPAELPVV